MVKKIYEGISVLQGRNKNVPYLRHGIVEDVNITRLMSLRDRTVIILKIQDSCGIRCVRYLNTKKIQAELPKIM